jgi:hypothetical protein
MLICNSLRIQCTFHRIWIQRILGKVFLTHKLCICLKGRTLLWHPCVAYALNRTLQALTYTCFCKLYYVIVLGDQRTHYDCNWSNRCIHRSYIFIGTPCGNVLLCKWRILVEYLVLLKLRQNTSKTIQTHRIWLACSLYVYLTLASLSLSLLFSLFLPWIPTGVLNFSIFPGITTKCSLPHTYNA